MSRALLKKRLAEGPQVSPFLVLGDPTPELSVELLESVEDRPSGRGGQRGKGPVQGVGLILNHKVKYMAIGHQVNGIWQTWRLWRASMAPHSRKT